MTITVEVESSPESGSWVNRTSIALLEGLSITSVGGAAAGTATVPFRDAAGTATILPECGLRVTDGAVVMFRGKIKKRGKVDVPTSPRSKWYTVTAQDATTLLTDDICDTGAVRSVAESDAARIVWIVSTFGTKGVTAALTGGGGYVQSLTGTQMPEQDYTGLNVYEAIGEVLKLSGGYIYVDTSLALHHFATESNPAPFNLSDSPNGSTTFGYQGFDFPDDSLELTNAVYVIGSGDVGEWVPNPATWPTASQTAYGRKESAFKDATLADTAARQAAGNAILARFDQPRGPIKCKVFRPGLRAGMVIQITNATWGLSAVAYRIEQVEATVNRATGAFEYGVSLQDAPVTLASVISGNSESIGRDVRRSGNAAVDYAAQFLMGRVRVVNSLPALPDAHYPPGTQVFYTGDNKLYRNPDDTGWVASIFLQDGLGQITSTQIADDAISTPKIAAGAIMADHIAAHQIGADQIAANSIVAGNIAAGAIGAEALAAQIILADKLIATDVPPNQRMEMDDLGLRAYDAANKMVVNIPSAGSEPVSVVGKIETADLTSTASAELRGANTLAAGSSTVAQIGITDPVAAPTVVVSTPAAALVSAPPYLGMAGLGYDSSGYGAVPTFWIGADPSVGNLLDLAYEYRASDGALVRTLRKTGTTQTLTTTLGSTSHVADAADAYDYSGSRDQVASPLTMPRAGRITKVSVYMAGYLGSATVRNAVWSSGGTLLGTSSAYTATSRTFDNGASDHYDKALSSPLSVSSGQVIRAGFLKTSGGIQFDRDDGSGKTLYLGDGGNADWDPNTAWTDRKLNVYVTYEYDVDSSVEGAVGRIIGVARAGSYVWVLDMNGLLIQYNQSDLTYVAKFDHASRFGGVPQNGGLFDDGNYLVITTVSGQTGTEQVRFVRINRSTGAYVDTITASGLNVNGGTATVRGGCAKQDALTSNHVLWWVVVNGVVRAYDTQASYAYVANREFGTSAECGNGLTHDGTYFRGFSASANRSLYRYTNWDWTSESAVYWCGYAWYDSVANPDTHETKLSPIWTATLARRRRLTVANPAIPGASTEPPDRVRVYLYRNATTPSAGSYWLQATDALTTRDLDTYTGSGSHDSASNTFPPGTAAEVKSVVQSGSLGWSLKGDGEVVLAPFQTYNPTKTNFGTATYTTSEAWYLRVGKMVFVNIRIVINSAGSGGGTLGIDLPIAPDLTAPVAQWLPGYLSGLTGVNNAASPAMGTIASTSTPHFNIRTTIGELLARANLQAGSGLNFQGWYRCA